MRDGICPKCQSTEVFKKKNGLGYGGGSGIFIYTSWMTSQTAAEYYICAQCHTL